MDKELTPPQRYRARKAEQGICVYCIKPAIQPLKCCEHHRDAGRAAKRDRAYKDRRNANRRARKRTDPAWAMADRLRKRIGRAIRDYAPGMKLRQTAQYIGCPMDTLMARIAAQFLPGMSWDNRDLWHIDHIRPCASFDLTDLEQQKECFHYTNLQPLWAEDNIRKHARYEQLCA